LRLYGLKKLNIKKLRQYVLLHELPCSLTSNILALLILYNKNSEKYINISMKAIYFSKKCWLRTLFD